MTSNHHIDWHTLSWQQDIKCIGLTKRKAHKWQK